MIQIIISRWIKDRNRISNIFTNQQKYDNDLDKSLSLIIEVINVSVYLLSAYKEVTTLPQTATLDDINSRDTLK